MLHIDITIENTRLIATVNTTTNTWQGRVVDNPTGESQQIEANFQEMVAILALAITDDDDTFYQVLADFVDRHGWHLPENKHFRFIP